MGEIAPENQTSRPPIDRLYSKWTVLRVSRAARMYPMNWSAWAPSNTSRSVLPSSSVAGRYRSEGFVGAILTYRPSASSARIPSLIAANNASSSASASRARGAAGFEVVLPGHQYSPGTSPGQLPQRRGGLVQHQPVQPQLAHRLHKLREVDGLPDVAVRAQPVA